MKVLLFIYYPKCSTCIKAKAWLDSHNISYIARDIKVENPKALELKNWNELGKNDIKSFFNTSGLVYKALDLKNKLGSMNIEEKYNILATDGMLVKRPLLIGDDFVLTGFKEAIWEAKLLK